MGPKSATEHQGFRLPPSRFASHNSRRHTLASSLLRLTACALTTLPLAAQSPHTQRLTATHQVSPTQHQTPAEALQTARAQHLALAQKTHATPHSNASLTAAWQPVGPSSITTPTFGNLTGRITALAADPTDTTGSTLYVGTTGGGVFKSTSAATSSPTFTPLTDTLSVFSPNAGTSVIPSLSIGALALQPVSANPILLAGTGDPNDATDSLYGEGLLRSADNGLTWSLIQNSHDGANGNHSFSGLATAAIAFSTATPSLAVAAFSTSAESTLVAATNPSSIPGLYYSTDAGVTWQMATVYDGSQVVQTPQPIGTGQVGNAATAVVWNPIRQRFYAAIRSHGYYSSPDGITWTRLSAQPGAALTSANCPVGANGTGSSTCPIFRGALTVQPTTGDLYAVTVDANNLDQGLYQDLCSATSTSCATPAPTFAHRIDNGLLETGLGVSGASTAIPQGVYNLTLAATPTSTGTLLLAGTTDIYTCTIASGSSTCALRNTTNALNGCNAPAGVAPAQHALVAFYRSNAPALIYIGNDGGLWSSSDAIAETGSPCAASDSTHFTNLNLALGTGGSLAELTGFTQHPTDPNTLIAGLGANGSAATSTASTLAPWPQLSAGEGGLPHIDPTNLTNWYISIGAGINLSACTLGTSCTAANFVSPATIGAPQTAYDTALLDAPTLLDPAQPTILLAATCRVWRGPAASGATWSSSNALSPAFDKSTTPCTSTSPLIRSLAAGGPSTTAGSSVIYAGLAGTLDGGNTLPGHLFVTTTANTTPTWTDTALPNPAGFDISSIAVDPHDPTGATVYATIAGFGVPHLYRSTNFGATWTNLSANLPNAPANAVLVDPNDANTVYIALDTGVYATQTIASCPSSNCWSVLGTSLPNSPVIALAAAPNMPAGTGLVGMPAGSGLVGILTAATYGRGLWQQPLLTVHSPIQTALTLSATALTFPTEPVGTQSPSQTLTVTSSGNAPAVFTSAAISGDFQIVPTSDTCSNTTLAIAATCTLQIVFAPTATGPRSGLLTLYANISGGQATVALSGTGAAPAAIVLTPLTLTFPATVINQTAPTQILTVANTGSTSATLQSPTITGNPDFTLTASTCSATLSPSTSCSLQISFTPTAAGPRSATLSLTDSAGTQTASLLGTGNTPATDTLTPLALTFLQTQVTTSSAPQLVTLSNAGDVPLTLIAASLPTPSDFTVTNNCGTSLAAKSTCAFSVTFVPSATGTRTSTLTITDAVRSQTVALNGIGIAPPGVSLSPATLTFAATGVGLTAPPQTLTLTNNGGLPLTLSNVAVSASFYLTSNTCGSTLAANAACTLQVAFSPTTPGPISGTLTLTDNAPSTTQTATLIATGIDFTLTPAGATSVTVSSGTSATYPLLLSSLPGLSGAVALTCAGAPAHTTCLVSPTSPSLGTTTSLVVTVATGVAALHAPTFFAPTTPRILYAFLLPLTLLLTVRKRHRLAQRLPLVLLASALSASLTTITGCGAGRIIPAPNTTSVTTPTASGTYNLTVSASAAGLTHTVPLTLIVQ
jgi:hypothetical protein